MGEKRVKRADDWPWQQPEGSRPVDVESITRDAALQVRSGVDPATVRKYASEMKAGAKFPPVELAETEDGTLLLVDGWHRMEAAHVINGQKTVEAITRAASRQEAAGWACMANLTHGKQLSDRDKRRALALYIKGRMHRTAKGLKTYREIEGELFIKRTTLHRWMAKDHPRIAREMARDQPESSNADAPPIHDSEPETVRCIEQALRDALALYGKLRTPNMRGRAEVACKELLGEMQQAEYTRRPFFGTLEV